jgi:NMD protein affecting ribosome stability and mRNA decay
MDEPIRDSEIEAEFMLEAPVRCPQCGEAIEELQVVRILRTKVNFVSSLPRRGQVMICPQCRAILTGSLGGLS